MRLNRNFILIAIYIIGITIIYFSLNTIKKNKIDKFEQINYLNKVHETKTYLKTLIQEKQNATLSIGLTTAKNKNIINALIYNNSNLINLQDISLDLRKHTNFKNIWFHLVSKDGIVLQRSYSSEKGDSLLKYRSDIKKMLPDPKVMSTISVGKRGMIFGSMIPVYDKNNNFIGILEAISHFNSISKKLRKSGMETVILVNKRYKKQITKPFTNTFLGDYYVANLDVDIKLLNHLRQEGINFHIKDIIEKGYHIENDINSIISNYNLKDIEGKPMSQFLLFNSLLKIDMSKIDDIKYIYNLYVFLAISFLTILFYFLYSIKQTEQIDMYSKRVIFILSIIFIILSTIIYYQLSYKLNTNIKLYKQEKMKDAIDEYNLIYSNNKVIANLIYESHINTEEIVALFKDKKREELYRTLKNKYKLFTEKYHIGQLHFHLKNSTSFLRMHGPKKYGDSLKGIRQSVDYVNKHLNPFDGFEEGKTLNAFRYVFPLFSKDKKHLGSVEISFSAYSFISSYLKNFNKRANFLINKKIVNDKVLKDEITNYIDSPVKGFYFDKEIVAKLAEEDKKIVPTKKNKFKLLEVSKKIIKGKPFTIHFNNAKELVTIVPLTNHLNGQISGSIHIAIDDKYIREKSNEFRLLITVLLIILAFIMIFIYREMISKQNFLLLGEKTQNLLDSQESFIIITDGKYIKESNKAMLIFFGYGNLDKFKNENDCICDFFEYEEGKDYLQKKMDTLNWFEYLHSHTDVELKVKMTNISGKSHIFKIEHKIYSVENKESIVSFLDITHIENMNIILKEKINKAVEDNLKKDKLLQEQSKLASMGEMIGSIAHQWRQPLNALNINIQNLNDDYEDGLIDEKFINEFIVRNRKTIEFMSHTIDDFRNFFRVDKTKKIFSILEACQSSKSIQSAQLKNYNIELNIQGEDFTIEGFKSEFQQVILNIINNAKDVMVDNDIQNGKIDIYLNTNIITIKDNAGGIPVHVLERIFEPYFTTKEQGKGTGMGLYMAKMIIEDNMGGKLNVANSDVGAEFIIKFNTE